MRWLRTLPERVRAADPLRVDIALAGLLTCATVLEVVLIAPQGARVVSAVSGAAAMAALSRRRSHPLAVIVVLVVALAVGELAEGFLLTASTFPFIGLFVATFSVGRFAGGWRGWGAVAAAVVVVGAAMLLQDQLRPEELLSGLVLVGLPFLAGRAMRRRVELGTELRRRTAELEAGGDLRARRAVEEERGRIAAELQVVVADGVSAMVVQAEAVPRVLLAGEVDRARQSLLAIEGAGREALAEMRRLLGVLRYEDDGALRAPQPSLEQSTSLVEAARRDGLDVELAVAGEPRGLSPGVDLAAFRVLQEALRSAAEAAGASRARVEIAYHERMLTVTVRDDRADAAATEPGAWPQLRERVDLYGGSVRAGPSPDGVGYRVSARLPREAASA